MRLTRQFFNQSTLKVAQQLLGKFIIRKISQQTLIGKIVETEAYKGFADRASHAHKGKTKRNELMFGPSGFSYIYLIYGMYNCFNITTEKENYPAAILIRAIEPIKGINFMKKQRKTNNVYNLCSGPGKFCQAFKLDRSLSGIDLTKSGEMWLESQKSIKSLNQKITRTKRIGIDYAGAYKNKLWRFYLTGSPLVS